MSDLQGRRVKWITREHVKVETIPPHDSRRSATLAVSAKFCLRYNWRPDSDVFTIYNVGTQCVSLAAANPQQTGESRFAVRFTYSFRRLDSHNSGPTVVNISRLRPLIR
jgi:hypothetical protein